jgi:hypothetical protein
VVAVAAAAGDVDERLLAATCRQQSEDDEPRSGHRNR